MGGHFHRFFGCRVLFLLLLLRDAAAFQFPQPSAPPLRVQYRQPSPFRRNQEGIQLVKQNDVLHGAWRPQARGAQGLTAVGAAPQPTELRMPKVSSGGGKGSQASSGFISAWHVQEGQHVKQGEALFVVESDKADVDVEAPHKGVLRKILVREGVRVEAGSVVGLLDHEAATEGETGSSGAEQTETVYNSAQLPAGAVALFMPALSSTMTHGTVTKWHKQEGDKIEVGDRILVVESDKADMEVEAFDAGYLAGIRAPNGTSAAVGDTIAYIVSKKEHVQELKQALEKHVATGGAPISKASAVAEKAQTQPSGPPPAQAAAEHSAAEAAEIEKVAQAAAAEWISPSVDQASSTQQLPGTTPQQLHQLLRHRLSSIAPAAADALADQKTSEELLRRAQLRLPPRVTLLAKSTRFGSSGEDSRNSDRPVLLTPAAEAFAAKHNITAKNVRGTGFGGRITLADVKQHIGMPAEPTRTQYSCSNANVPAQDSASNAQPLTRGIAVDALFEMMKQLKSGDFANAASITKEEDFVAPGLSVLLAKAVALTLKKHPLLNARFDGEAQQIINPPSVDIAMAVSIKGGLVTPVLKDVVGRDVFTLARSWRHQVAAAQAHDFVTAGLTGGTFYISNLGMSAIEQFDALLPQNVGCIMAVGSVTNVLTPSTDNTGGLRHKKQMNVTLTCDHRHIYGQHAADFLTDLASLIEKAPNALLMA
ncbi:hypothetical protein ACSSS7_002628 [Eimeria intestinalis]